MSKLYLVDIIGHYAYHPLTRKQTSRGVSLELKIWKTEEKSRKHMRNSDSDVSRMFSEGVLLGAYPESF